MRMELREFVQAARTMHQQPGGIKRTRLMLRMRPYQSRKTFILKATDGRATITARVEHQGQLKLVESIVNDFVGECTKASVVTSASAPSPGGAADSSRDTAASAAAKSAGQPGASNAPAPAASAAPAPSASAAAAAPAANASAAHNASHNTGGRQNKGKKGKRH